MLRKDSDIPPLMFTAAELESPVVGTRFVRAFAGDKLAEGAQAALFKIEAVLPPELRERSARTRIYAPIWRSAEQAAFAARIDQLHAAIDARHVRQIVYRNEAGEASTRQVESLCLAFWGGKWTLGTWCRLRSAFRSFRPDRVGACDATGERFEDMPNRNFGRYLQVCAAITQAWINADPS